MNIAFVNATRKWGGVKTWTLDYGRALQERGHGIDVVAREGTPFVDACRSAGFRVHPFRFGPKYNPLAIARMVRIFRRCRPDVVVVNISKDLEIGAVAARLCGIPVVHRVGLVEDYRGTLEERWRHRWLVTRVLVPSERMRDRLLRRFPWLSPDEIWAVPNAKFLDRYPMPPEKGEGPLVFGTASQLSPSKGHEFLLEAFARLLGSGVDARLRLAGTGELEAALKARADRLRIADKVEFLGFVEDIPEFLASLSVYVLPSLKEGFPNSLLEAVCAGLPCVATRLEGVEELVGDAARLSEPGDAEALARAMADLAQDPGRRRRLGEAARRLARDRYDVRKNALVLFSRLQEITQP